MYVAAQIIAVQQMHIVMTPQCGPFVTEMANGAAYFIADVIELAAAVAAAEPLPSASHVQKSRPS